MNNKLSYPIPHLHSNRLRARVSLPEGTYPNGRFPHPPSPFTMQRMRDTKQIMQTHSHMNHKIGHELPVETHVQLCSETGSVCHFFWQGHLTLKSCTCSTGATGMGSPDADLVATWAAGLAALMGEGLARGWAALELAVGSSPCGKHNLGRHNTAPRRLEIDNSTSGVRVTAMHQ